MARERKSRKKEEPHPSGQADKNITRAAACRPSARSLSLTPPPPQTHMYTQTYTHSSGSEAAGPPRSRHRLDADVPAIDVLPPEEAVHEPALVEPAVEWPGHGVNPGETDAARDRLEPSPIATPIATPIQPAQHAKPCTHTCRCNVEIHASISMQRHSIVIWYLLFVVCCFVVVVVVS